jgi:tetratricopeptide (TPR) repeat protein
MRFCTRFCFLFSLLVFVAEVVSAQAFPFRAVRKGTPLPSVSVEALSGSSVKLSTLDKGVVVLLFWGADSKIKKQHAIKALREIPAALKGVGNRVTFMSVNVLEDAPETVKAVSEKAGYKGPLYISDSTLYKALGIFVIPAVLIAKNGKVEAGFGYTHDFSDVIKGEVEVLLGLKSREAVEATLHPKTETMNDTEKEAMRYSNLGRTMLTRGMVTQAEDAFRKALTQKADYVPALLGLAEIYLKRGDATQASSFVKKAEAVSPDDLETVLMKARVLAAQKKVEDALATVLPLAMTHPGSREIDAVLGQLYEQKGDLQKAVKYYKKALSLCQQGR